MEHSDDNAWTGRNIFAHLNDFEESQAENILASNHSQTPSSPTPQPEPERSDSSHGKSSKESAKAKIGIKIPKLEGTNKNYVLQCEEDMTQDFMDYLKEMSLSFCAVSDTGGKPTGSFQIKCEYCKEVFTTEDFECHQCDLYEDNAFDGRNILKRIRENSALIATLLKNNSAEADSSTNNHPPKVKDVPKNKKKNGPFECTLCDRKFIYESGLTSHMAKHALECPLEPKQLLKHVVKCLKCSQVLCGDNIGKAIDHFVRNHGYSVEPNGKTDAETDLEPVSADSIYKCVIINAVFQCEFCDFLFCDVNGLLNHSASHHPKLGFECTWCELNFATLKEISSHRQSECPFHDKNVNFGLQTFYVCNVCNTNFMSLEFLYDHRSQQRHFFPRKADDWGGGLAIGCEKCEVVVDSADAMTSHAEEHYMRKSRWRNFEANSAPVAPSFPNSRNRKYLCEVCGKTYTQSSHLWQHLRFHQGIKPFVCTEPNCNRKFTIRPDLNDHIRKCHTGERPYHCLICGKRFLTGSVFYQHRLIHRGERRYGCDQCNKRFYRADALKNHLRIHSGERPYPCPNCPKSFRQRGDREKHIRARHNKHEIDLQPSMAKLKSTHIMLDGPVRSKKELLLRNQLRNALKMQENAVDVGGVSFPKSMFRPILGDIDANIM
ncbi:testis-specific zinc finger protein topi-like [Bradysia coprophila]|uniref:testis-specific zinc finger protein topi-like n=1 Tax=Bradysia coprophila TaxID=38358 RepID=UPI00187DA763|nr:testis-specific zinc finger protein topi-like [Bradysia coprophila]